MDAPMPRLSNVITWCSAAKPSTTRGSQLSRTAARWTRNTTGVPGLFVPSSRYANSTPPAVIVRVGTFFHVTFRFYDALMIPSLRR